MVFDNQCVASQKVSDAENEQGIFDEASTGLSRRH